MWTHPSRLQLPRQLQQDGLQIALTQGSVSPVLLPAFCGQWKLKKSLRAITLFRGPLNGIKFRILWLVILKSTCVHGHSAPNGGHCGEGRRCGRYAFAAAARRGSPHSSGRNAWRGTVLQVRPARSLHRNGQLRIVFREIILPEGAVQNVHTSLQGIQSDTAQNVQLDSEGGAKATSSVSRYFSTGSSVGLALLGSGGRRDVGD
jgi:hypothetical protein